MSEQKIKIKCYGTVDEWDSREEAMAFYFEGMMECDGAEKERYTNIYMQLVMGRNECTDERMI